MEAASTSWRSLGDVFVERGVISQADLERALAEQVATKRRLADILVTRGLVTGRDITTALMEQLGTAAPTQTTAAADPAVEEPRAEIAVVPDIVEPEPVDLTSVATAPEPAPDQHGPVTWRPLGELFVERGLITQNDLEEALVEQHETGKRLGTILVSRELVSGTELVSVLVDQLGTQLTEERADLQHADLRPWPSAEESPTQSDKAAVPPPPRAAGTSAVESALTEEREALTAAFEKERAELRLRSIQERTAIEAGAKEDRALLEAALTEERNAHQQALEDLVQSRADASARAGEFADLSWQVAELRAQIELSSTIVVAELGAIERLKEIETVFAAERESHLRTREQLETARAQTAEAEVLAARLRANDEAIAAAQVGQREATDELNRVRAEASEEAKELRASIDRMRGELDRLDAATAWFEYWSGTTAPPARSTSQTE